MNTSFRSNEGSTSERRENHGFNPKRTGSKNVNNYRSYRKQNSSGGNRESTDFDEESAHGGDAQASDNQRNTPKVKHWPENESHRQKSRYEGTSKNWKPRDNNFNSAAGYRHKNNYKEELPSRLSQSSAAAISDLSIGCVVNGRYVRKESNERAEMKLNVNAPIFTPKGQSCKEESTFFNSNNTKQRYTNEKQNLTGHCSSEYSSEINHRNHRVKEAPYNQNPYPNKSRTYKNTGRRQITSDKDADRMNCKEPQPAVNNCMRKENISAAFPATTSMSSVPKNKESTTQRERLESQLTKGDCECLVCCEPIRPRDYVWSCRNCYHVLHLRCIKKWARSPTAVVKDGGWRCPACQNVSATVPYEYYCFCGKCKDPEMNYHFTPHSCGDVCGRNRDDVQCVHRCNIPCHPGPCPPCTATTTKACECGKTKKTVPCAKNEPIICASACGKILNCGVHSCDIPCHIGPCKSCNIILTQSCFCGKNQKEVVCDSSTSTETGYGCNMPCGGKLLCGNHFCSAACHFGSCATCKLLPSIVSTCPCGKTTLKQLYSEGKLSERLSCTDPIPLCDNKCEKLLLCGPKDNRHLCSEPCHVGECAPCELTTMVKCRCGSTTKEMTCTDMLKLERNFLCERRCNRRKDCGRHKCLNHCCINLVHKCELVCGKKLSCGSHQCQETCHDGNCPTCWNVSFDELRCHCGYSVLYPPIHCGTKPPECDQPCVRLHSCEHKVQHPCHSDEACPPCTVLTVKWCFGKHEKRPSVQCFLDGMSCGKLCNKPLPCGRHNCRDVCHTGSCIKSNPKCTQLCTELRVCGHPCASACHDGSCPDSICKAKVEVSCPCGHRNEVTSCSEDATSYRLMSVSMLASKIQDIKAGESVNISDIFNKKGKTNRLQCNEECAVLDRNKRLAVALQIQNPELSCKPGPPNYSEFLKEEARKNIKFVSSVYDKCIELVQLAKQSKQKSRSFAFPPMNRDHRRVVHELASFFGCDTQSYDEEPKKNVVITAFRDKSWLPFVSLLTIVERDMGIRRGPQPITAQTTSKVQVTVTIPEKKEKVIDYFDYTEP